MMGIGPECYCVIASDLPDFEYHLSQVLEHLPSHKVCLYPPRTSLKGPFLLPPWNTVGRMICSRPSWDDDDSVTFSHLMQEEEVDSFVEGCLIPWTSSPAQWLCLTFPYTYTLWSLFLNSLFGTSMESFVFESMTTDVFRREIRI